MPNANRPSDQRELNTLLETLDRLEELLEDMDELGVGTRAETEARMREIHARVDELERLLPPS